MLLSNLSLVDKDKKVDILVENTQIRTIKDYPADFSNKQNIVFDNAIAFPGLINSHDHLDFNSFPQLGNRIYNNYVEWGDDIHAQDKPTINKVLKIPLNLRVQWGIYKNLLNGITTVVNHGPGLTVGDTPISIWQDCHVLHSIELEKRWKYKLNWPFARKQPFAIHVGEGTDSSAREEIDTLIKWNLLNRDLVGIHAIAMDARQAERFKAIIWCPDSNYFLIGKTAQIDKLKEKTKILFGTDSTVSAKWNLWEHLRLARQQNMVSDTELYEMLTHTPAKVWPIPQHGRLEEGYTADIVIAMEKGLAGMNAFFALNPEDILMVMHQGRIRLFDEELYQQLSNQGFSIRDFYKISINGICKYISGNVPQLINSIKEYYPEAEFPITC